MRKEALPESAVCPDLDNMRKCCGGCEGAGRHRQSAKLAIDTVLEDCLARGWMPERSSDLAVQC